MHITITLENLCAIMSKSFEEGVHGYKDGKNLIIEELGSVLLLQLGYQESEARQLMQDAAKNLESQDYSKLDFSSQKKDDSFGLSPPPPRYLEQKKSISKKAFDAFDAYDDMVTLPNPKKKNTYF